MNLGGFCTADSAVCSPTGPAPSGTPTADQIKASSATAQAAQVTSAVGNYLLGFAARFGKQYVCPFVPLLAATAGEAVAIAFLPAEIAVIGPIAGVEVTITAAEFGKAIGAAAGLDFYEKVCA